MAPAFCLNYFQFRDSRTIDFHHRRPRRHEFRESEIVMNWIARMMSVGLNMASKPIRCHPNAGVFAEAEKELSAFLTAVTAVHGEECVTTAAKHWMLALEQVCPPAFASKECFRKVTLSAAVSLSRRWPSMTAGESFVADRHSALNRRRRNSIIDTSRSRTCSGD